MSEQNSELKDALKQVNKSGFPFQLRVEDEIKQSVLHHRWYVLSSEQPWENADAGRSGFIDLVLTNDSMHQRNMVIECKRMLADNKDNETKTLKWVFLIPPESIDQKTLSSYYRVDGELQEGNNIKWRGKRKWCEGQAEPETHESQFCVWPNDRESNKGQSMLETLAGDVLASAEGLGEEYIRLHQFEKGYNIVDKMIIPVIVTNVDLFICKFKPETLDLLSGTLKEENAEVEKVPYIRFRKTLTKSYSEFLGSLRLANKARERTVFIVNVEHLVDFLSKWKSDFWNH